MHIYDGCKLWDLNKDYFKWILCNELKMISTQIELSRRLFDDGYGITKAAKRILEIARNSTVLRYGNIAGRLTEEDIAYESDSAHTNLVRALVDLAIDFGYGYGFDGLRYSRRTIGEAILLHDLPENITGDTPDNRLRNLEEKRKIESEYFDELCDTYGPVYYRQRHLVQLLHEEMEEKSSTEGRLLYVADKLSAILMMLCYDFMGKTPSITPESKYSKGIDGADLKLCERRSSDGKLLLSELWTIDFLHSRKLNQYDDSGFYTAILIAVTLYASGKWYKWRENQYIIG